MCLAKNWMPFLLYVRRAVLHAQLPDLIASSRTRAYQTVVGGHVVRI